jgi:hypothetical protein
MLRPLWKTCPELFGIEFDYIYHASTYSPLAAPSYITGPVDGDPAHMNVDGWSVLPADRFDKACLFEAQAMITDNQVVSQMLGVINDSRPDHVEPHDFKVVYMRHCVVIWNNDVFGFLKSHEDDFHEFPMDVFFTKRLGIIASRGASSHHEKLSLAANIAADYHRLTCARRADIKAHEAEFSIKLLIPSAADLSRALGAAAP